MRSVDRDSQDKNLVGSLDRFAKTADSRDSDDSILITHVYPKAIGMQAQCSHNAALVATYVAPQHYPYHCEGHGGIHAGFQRPAAATFGHVAHDSVVLGVWPFY